MNEEYLLYHAKEFKKYYKAMNKATSLKDAGKSETLMKKTFHAAWALVNEIDPDHIDMVDINRK